MKNIENQAMNQKIKKTYQKEYSLHGKSTLNGTSKAKGNILYNLFQTAHFNTTLDVHTGFQHLNSQMEYSYAIHVR
jgi:hypothetical protein